MELLRKFYTNDYGFGGGNYYDDPQYQQLLRQASGQGLWGSVGMGAATGAVGGVGFGGVGALVGGLVGAGTALYTGLTQENKAKSLLNASRPTQNVPQSVLENQEIARTQALQGTPSAQYQQAMKNIQRQSNQAVVSAQSRNAGIGLIGSVQQRQNDATGQLDAQSAATRLANIKQLLGVNNTVGGYQNQAFDWNQKQKYLQNYSYGMNLLGSGNQNIVGGIDRATAGLMRSGALNGLFGANPNAFNGTGKPAGWYGSDPFVPPAGDTQIVPQAANSGNYLNEQSNDLGV